MTQQSAAPVLLIGGTGIVGREALGSLRRRYPDLPLAIGSRSLARAAALADQLGTGVLPVEVDPGRRAWGLASGQQFSAIVMLLKDETMSVVKYAQRTGTAYLDISTAVFEIGPEVSLHAQHPTAAPILLSSNWLAGASTWAALHFAQQFARVDTVRVAALLDELDIGGSAAEADYERQTGAGPSGLVLRDGRWRWTAGADAVSRFVDVAGREHVSTVFANLDVLSLTAQLDPAGASFEFAVGETSQRRAGGSFSTEIIIELDGTRLDGSFGRSRFEVVHPHGQAPLTGVAISLGVGGLLGLDGRAPAAAGLHLPHTLVDAAHAVDVMSAAGATFRTA